MKLVFFDEVKNDRGHPHYHIGAVCIDENSLKSVEDEMSKLAKEVFGNHILESSTEFHASEIYNRRKNFKSWADIGKRYDVLRRLIAILSRDDVYLIDIQINIEKFYGPLPPEEVAFMFLCERVDAFLNAKRSLGMLIGDRESDQTSQRFSKSLSEYRTWGTEYAFGQGIKNLVEPVHFTHSHLSRFLQLADIYAWTLQFQLRNRLSKDEKHKSIFNILHDDNINLSPSKYKIWPK
ncbi:hypothetical protein NITGR_360026 [Nitrospina gracilis 3/211]|uniref:DUF3800 domain-containing protein n=1 Tax=Nitrospina gracilis (strain 3/211) TaxID=1266370 RepID=M1YYD8_NITG3|nr:MULTISPECIES: DUF3800 domain-containing protein [Nitrospina]MCF8723607.1 hypothetical protein [Nitrospina sp. Nb-3]CCQ90688.1 hypothetical protein NITGR_360026 [Nitrospina gracilis 3/211]